MSKQIKRVYEFGPFRLDTRERLLLRHDQPLTLTPKVFDMLVALIENNCHLLEKEELIKAVWPDTFVDENTLISNISILRKVLGQNNGAPYIETVPKRGYRFVAEVRELQCDSTDLVLEKHHRARIVIQEVAEGHQETGHTEQRPALSVPTGFDGRKINRILLALLPLIGLTVALLYFSAGRSKPNPSPLRSIAVLPFKNLGTPESDEYLGMGLADALITRLGNIKQIVVKPTTTIQKFAGQTQDPIAAGRELKVDAVLDGRLQKADGRLRLTVQLLNVQKGVPLWAGKFDENDSDWFRVQDSLSEAVARAMLPELAGAAPLTKRYTDNREANEAYLRGRYFWNKRTADNARKSIAYFQSAIALDPDFAVAYAGLADAYLFSELEKTERVPAARAAAEKALAIDDSLAEAHTTLANISLFHDWNWQQAEREFQRALELNPNYPTAHHWYAYELAALGRLDEALAEIRRAQELDPLSLIINTDVGQLLYFARDYDGAIEQLRKTLEMDANFVMAHYRLGEVYGQKGMYAEAIAEFQQARSVQYGKLQTPFIIGHAYALSGNRPEALKILTLLKKEFMERRNGHFFMAIIYADLGDKEQSLDWLEKAYEYRDNDLILLKVNPQFDSLRSDSRFTDLLRRLNL